MLRIVLTIAILVGAAILEWGGDALIRLGLHGVRLWMLAGRVALAC